MNIIYKTIYADAASDSVTLLAAFLPSTHSISIYSPRCVHNLFMVGVHRFCDIWHVSQLFVGHMRKIFTPVGMVCASLAFNLTRSHKIGEKGVSFWIQSTLYHGDSVGFFKKKIISLALVFCHGKLWQQTKSENFPHRLHSDLTYFCYIEANRMSHTIFQFNSTIERWLEYECACFRIEI